MTVRTFRPLFVVLCLAAAAPAWADFRMERRLALPPGGAFTLRTNAGAVTVIGDSTDGVTVTVTGNRTDLARRMRFDFSSDNATASVTAVRRPSAGAGWRSWLGLDGVLSDRVRFEVHVPHRTGVAVQTAGGSITVERLAGGARVRTAGGPLRLTSVVGEVDARTSGGPIHVRQIGGDVSARTSGGRIIIEETAGRVAASTNGGPIRVRAARGDLVVKTDGGGIRIDEAGGRVEARTSGGPIDVSFASGNNRGGSLITSGGGVRAVVDPSTSMSLDLSSAGGAVRVDLPVQTRGAASRHALQGDLNGGGPRLEMRSSGGPVRLARR